MADQPIAPTTIRVVEVKHTLTDPTNANEEELRIIFASILQLVDPVGDSSSLNLASFLDLARILQSVLATFLTIHDSNIESVRIREILLNPAIRPMLLANGDVRTRPATRIRAINADGSDAAVAAEEHISINGFAVDPQGAGDLIWLNIGCGAPLDFDVAAISGAFSTPLATCRGDARPPEYIIEDPAPVSVPPGFKYVSIHAISALMRQTSAAINYYLSGAATAVIAARIMSAVKGADGASPTLIAAFGMSANLLSTVISKESIPIITWRHDVDIIGRLRYLVDRLAKTEPIVASDPGTWLYDLSPLNDLFRVGALSIYLYALTEGRESMHLDIFLERASIRFMKEQQLREIFHQAVMSSARARMYVMIIEDKFGAARVHTVITALQSVGRGSRVRNAPGGTLATPSDSVQINDPDAVLMMLTKKEQAVVGVEYDNRQKEWEASVANKCPHIPIVYRLRTASSIDVALKSLKALEKYLAPQSAATVLAWIMCRSCGFRALCPHVRDRITMEAKRMSYDEIRTQLMKYAVQVQSNEGESYTYYCQICSEKLAEIIEEDRTAEALGRFGDLDSGLRTHIWTIALTAAKYIRFPTPVYEKHFANTTTSIVFPFVMAAEAAVIKKGRRRKIIEDTDEDTIDPRTKLYAIIFVYAYVLGLTQSSDIGFAGVPLKAKPSIYAEKMLQLIAEIYRTLIIQIEDISTEYIKTRFTEAYKIIRTDGSVSAITTTNPEEELVMQTVTIDPVYRYASTMARIAGELPINRASGPAAARREFETILGNTLTNIIKIARESARNPTLAPLYLRRTGIEVPSGGTLDFLVKDPRVNLYTNLYEPKHVDTNAVKTFLTFSDNTIGTDGIKYWFGAGTHVDILALAERGAIYEGYRMFAKYTKAIVNQDAFDAYLEELAAYRKCENNLRIAKALLSIKPYYDFGFAKSQQYIPVQVPITILYDESGRRHDWSAKVTYYYRTNGRNELEIKGGPKGIHTARNDGTLLPEMTLVDIACPICGIRMSQVGDINPEKVEQSIRATSELETFFVFYESRCPLGGFHNWVAGKCQECGLNSAILKEIAAGQTDNARAYYDKYVAKFQTARHAVRSDSTIIEPSVIPTPNLIDATSWKPNFTLVVKAAELIGVNTVIIEAIGNMEGREYAEIIEGHGIPAPPTAMSDPRIYTVDAEVRLMLSDYNMVRNALRFSKMPAAVAELLTTAGVPPHEYSLLSTVMLDVSENYHAMYAAMQVTRTPAEVIVFAIQSICRIALAIAATSAPAAPWAGKLGTAFAKKELELILRGQKLFSKPSTFNWAIFETDEDPEVDDQVGDVGEDITEPVADPFSGADYDTSENNPNNE